MSNLASRLSARLKDACSQPELDLPQPARAKPTRKESEVHGKFAEKSHILPGLTLKALTLSGYSNKEVGESETGESQMLPSGLFS